MKTLESIRNSLDSRRSSKSSKKNEYFPRLSKYMSLKKFHVLDTNNN